MGYTTIETRRAMIRALRTGVRVKDVARIFDVSRKTVWKWRKRICRKGWPHYGNISRRPHTIYPKITPHIENAIVLLRDSFRWGTQRIKVNLETPPDYIKHLLETVLGVKWESIRLSRQAINNILRKHKRNGSPYGEIKHWKYFHAKYPDQLWQMDIRGPFTIGSKRCLALIIIDDNSIYLISCTLHANITTEDILRTIWNIINKAGRKPSKILVDRGSQFKHVFVRGCKRLCIVVEYTPPGYPQSKGKVERCIRTFNEEFLRLNKMFENTEDLVPEFVRWYNYDRYYMGINGVPADLYLNGSNVTHVP